jgi:Bacterial Ig-like domain (group 3)
VTASKTPTGSVSVYYFGNRVLSGQQLINGQAQISSAFLPTNFPALYQITASYDGDANNLPSTSAAITQAITGTIYFAIQANTGLDQHNLSGTVGLQ